MLNPELQRSPISARQMYSYDTGNNIPWNIKQYELPALHFDQKQIVRQRQYAAQKKGVKANDFYVTKRGFYMDYDLKIAKDIPGPDKHQKNEPWPQNKKQLSDEQVKTVRSSIKYTYLDRIQMEQKNRPSPGISTYHLAKSMQDLKVEHQKMKARKIQHGNKRFFYENTEQLSNQIPGMGNYNPHLSVDKIKQDKTDFKFWITKHEKMSKLNTSRDLIKPNPATYTPLNQSYDTFQRTFSLPKKNKVRKNGFGSDSRFPYTRPNKKIIVEERPAPWQYQTKIQWKAKGNISPKKKLWNQILYTGSPPKVYH